MNSKASKNKIRKAETVIAAQIIWSCKLNELTRFKKYLIKGLIL